MRVDMTALTALVAEVRGDSGQLGVCNKTSKLIEERYGWPVEKGYWQMRTLHCWNILPDGSILDCTADQFGQEMIQILPANHPDYRTFTWQEHQFMYDNPTAGIFELAFIDQCEYCGDRKHINEAGQTIEGCPDEDDHFKQNNHEKEEDMHIPFNPLIPVGENTIEVRTDKKGRQYVYFGHQIMLDKERSKNRSALVFVNKNGYTVSVITQKLKDKGKPTRIERYVFKGVVLHRKGGKLVKVETDNFTGREAVNNTRSYIAKAQRELGIDTGCALSCFGDEHAYGSGCVYAYTPIDGDFIMPPVVMNKPVDNFDEEPF